MGLPFENPFVIWLPAVRIRIMGFVSRYQTHVAYLMTCCPTILNLSVLTCVPELCNRCFLTAKVFIREKKIINESLENMSRKRKKGVMWFLQITLYVCPCWVLATFHSDRELNVGGDKLCNKMLFQMELLGILITKCGVFFYYLKVVFEKCKKKDLKDQ